MSQPQQVISPPGTEDILASIRKILYEDLAPNKSTVVSLKQRKAERAKSVAVPRVVPKQSDVQANDDVLELTSEMQHMVQPDPKDDVLELGESSSVDQLVSNKTAQETAQAFADLRGVQSSLMNRLEESSFGEQSLNQFTHEVMRPLLKQWLDAHLPAVVKSLVAEEIGKIAQK